MWKKAEQHCCQQGDLVRSKGERAAAPLMGLVMLELRGKADGAIVSAIIEEGNTKYTKRVSPKKLRPGYAPLEETLFKDRDRFELDHLPSTSPPEAQMNSLKFCIRPHCRAAGGQCSMPGPPGTGKTRRFSSSLRRSRPILPKSSGACQLSDELHKICGLLPALQKIFQHAPPSSGSPSSASSKRWPALADENKVLVVALDDINYLFLKRK